MEDITRRALGSRAVAVRAFRRSMLADLPDLASPLPLPDGPLLVAAQVQLRGLLALQAKPQHRHLIGLNNAPVYVHIPV